jgi:hypothetical protein
MYEDISIKTFIKAWFNEDRSELTKEQFDEVYNEYINTAKLFESEQFAKVSYLHYVNNRINSISIAIDLQRKFLKTFDVPFEENLKFFMKFGHRLIFKDKESFLQVLNRIELKEKKYISIAENTLKEIISNKSKKSKGEFTLKQSRESFLSMLNSLGKIGYKIDKDTTTVEELALMIKQQSEEVAQVKNH